MISTGKKFKLGASGGGLASPSGEAASASFRRH